MRLLSPVLLAAVLSLSSPAWAQSESSDYAELFAAQVPRKLDLAAEDVTRYQQLLVKSLATVQVEDRAQFFVLVDRNPQAQRLVLFIGTPAALSFVGAAPVATGNTGRSDYYITPLGVHEHKLLVDFRAEGTKNQNGIRGYGSRGMRVWDFGWVPATKGWKLKTGEVGDIRFQMHATDPAVLEPKLGKPASKGCVRVPESLNKFLDQYGVLDGAYDEAAAQGKRPWVWSKDHQASPFSGRFLVVVDTAETPVGL